VLICDDVADFRQLLVAVLGRSDRIEVAGQAADGAEAVEVARATQPDVVLLDVAMPVMDGLEALPLIREAAPGTRVIMLTGFSSPELRERAADGGASGYVEKGASPGAIVDAVLAAWSSSVS
jgi:DNA-binding NarL/FixJ family response regulator